MHDPIRRRAQNLRASFTLSIGQSVASVPRSAGSGSPPDRARWKRDRDARGSRSQRKGPPERPSPPLPAAGPRPVGRRRRGSCSSTLRRLRHCASSVRHVDAVRSTRPRRAARCQHSVRGLSTASEGIGSSRGSTSSTSHPTRTARASTRRWLEADTGREAGAAQVVGAVTPSMIADGALS